MLIDLLIDSITGSMSTALYSLVNKAPGKWASVQ